MSNIEILDMLNKIEEYIRNSQNESVLRYIDCKKKELNFKNDIASEYISKLMENLK